MRTHNICLYKKVNKKYTGCNLKTTEFHECALIGVCAVIRSTTVSGAMAGDKVYFSPIKQLLWVLLITALPKKF